MITPPVLAAGLTALAVGLAVPVAPGASRSRPRRRRDDVATRIGRRTRGVLRGRPAGVGDRALGGLAVFGEMLALRVADLFE